MRSIFPEIVEESIKINKNIYVILGDIGVYSFRKIFKKFPNNIENIGLIEQSMIGIAAGMSICGHIPVVHTIAPFLVERAYEQLKIDFGYQNLRGNFITVGGAFDYSGLGSTHHCPADINLISSIPNFECIIPGHPEEFKILFNETVNNLNPTYIRLSGSSNKNKINVKFGKANMIKNDGDLVIIAIGDMLQDVIEATINLPVTILYYTTLKPFDYSLLSKYLDKKIVIVGSMYSGSIENEIIKNIKFKPSMIDSISIPINFIHNYGTKGEIKKLLGLEKKQIRKKILRLLKKDA